MTASKTERQKLGVLGTERGLFILMEMTEVAKVDGEEPWREVTLVAGTKEGGLREDENEKESKAREEAGVDFGRANLRVTVCFSVQLALSHIEKYHFLLSPEQSVLFIPLSF